MPLPKALASPSAAETLLITRLVAHEEGAMTLFYER